MVLYIVGDDNFLSRRTLSVNLLRMNSKVLIENEMKLCSGISRQGFPQHLLNKYIEFLLRFIKILFGGVSKVISFAGMLHSLKNQQYKDLLTL